MSGTLLTRALPATSSAHGVRRDTGELGHASETARGGSLPAAPALVRQLSAITAIVALLAVVGGRPVAALFALTTVGVGALLYRRDPSAYLGYAWWLWMLAPSLRRMVDYRHGTDPLSPVLLAPLLVSSITLVDAFHHLPKLRRPAFLPFGLVGGGLLYGYIIGVARSGLIPASYGFLNWAVPPAFGLHIALRWRAYPEYRLRLQHLLVVGTLVLGVYGVAQWYAPLAWDRQWIVESGMASIGHPRAFQFRVFSFLNSVGPYASITAASIVLLLSVPGSKRVVALCCGATALLLTLGRTAWLACAAGTMVYLGYLRMGARVRAVVAITTLTVAAMPLIMASEIVSVVAPRMQTFASVENDVSYQERTGFMGQMLDAVTSDPVGYGLGATGAASVLSTSSSIRDFDNGLLDIWYSLGWVGAALFFLGLAMIVAADLRRLPEDDDRFVSGARGAFFCILLQMTAVNVLTGVTGVVGWTFAGALVAAREWHRNEGRHNLRTQNGDLQGEPPTSGAVAGAFVTVPAGS